MVQFVLPTLKANTIITHRFEVIEHSRDAMVNSRDIMGVLGLIINFKAKIVQWEDSTSKLNTGHHIAVDDYDVTEETKEAADKAVQPEQLLPEHLEGGQGRAT
ncbi:unnamed protein product [Phytophthora fragariaefolia]|uniref:Unnamed protein product n=1 Tax=Phytophthora fragariaefolia TaxID=1490495 RepID=A0A9W6XLV3_9STRA|nr:unnamed protein product [Phytophthora fragariaefolia]